MAENFRVEIEDNFLINLIVVYLYSGVGGGAVG
jgi:hypothetical protein